MLIPASKIIGGGWGGLVPVLTPMHSLTEYTISLQVLSRQEI